ncbi:hypothetical protein KQX54_002479 [Cotesia glomerata]|uniref:Uncharacterized protein n=1 Tax=Cotesia glomerata TaxID=32391 RepID=A0AAV7I9B8_COTGL|nr:hypothetical protein KQX54_002479 [Cotesia glomerata]
MIKTKDETHHLNVCRWNLNLTLQVLCNLYGNISHNERARHPTRKRFSRDWRPLTRELALSTVEHQNTAQDASVASSREGVVEKRCERLSTILSVNQKMKMKTKLKQALGMVHARGCDSGQMKTTSKCKHKHRVCTGITTTRCIEL